MVQPDRISQGHSRRKIMALAELDKPVENSQKLPESHNQRPSTWTMSWAKAQKVWKQNPTEFESPALVRSYGWRVETGPDLVDMQESIPAIRDLLVVFFRNKRCQFSFVAQFSLMLTTFCFELLCR